MPAPAVSVSVARHRVAAAADAGALAAAVVVGGFGTAFAEEPCAAAELLATRHGGELVACEIDGLVVTVEVAVGTGFGPVAMRATAGPPGAD